MNLEKQRQAFEEEIDQSFGLNLARREDPARPDGMGTYVRLDVQLAWVMFCHALSRQSEELAEARRELKTLVELGAVMRTRQNRFAESYLDGDASAVRSACEAFDKELSRYAERINRERKQALTPPTQEKQQ